MAEREFIGGATNTVIHTEEDGTMHIEERQDVAPIIEYTHAARNHRFDADSLDGMLRHEGEIPFVIFQEECKRRGIVPNLASIESTEVIEAILRDPKYAKFRAAPNVRDQHIIMKGLR